MAAVFVGLLLFATYKAVSTRNIDFLSTDYSSNNPSIIESSKAFIQTPGGFYILLQGDTKRTFNWKLESKEPLSDGKNEVTGTFTRIAGGWEASENTLTCAPGSKAALTIYDGDEELDKKEIVIPESMFKVPFSAFFSYEGISAHWEFIGHSPATIRIINQLTGKELYKKEINDKTFTLSAGVLNYRGPLTISLNLPSKGLKEKNVTLPQANNGIYGIKHGSTDMEMILEILSESGKRAAPSEGVLPIGNQFTGKITGSVMKDNILYITTKTGKLMCFEINPEIQPQTRLLWQKSFADINALSKYKDEKSMDYPPELVSSTIIATDKGIDCYSLGDGSDIYSFTLNGEVSSRKVPFFKWWNDSKLKPRDRNRVGVLTSGSNRMYHWGNSREKRVFLETEESKELSLIKTDSMDNWIRFTFDGFNTNFFWVMEGLSQRFSVLKESEGKWTLKDIKYVAKPAHIYDKPVFAYDDKLKVAIFNLNGAFYELHHNNEDYICKHIPLALPRATTICELSSLGNGRFVGIGLTGISDKLFGISNNLDISLVNIQVDRTTGTISTSLHTTGEKLITDTDLSHTSKPALLNNGKICFKGGISLYIFSEDLDSLIFKKTVGVSLNEFFIKENYILGVNTRHSRVYLLNYGKSLQ
jgi:hypothetical protein